MTFVEIILPILLFILGTCLASFGNVLVCRYPDWNFFKKEKEFSACPKCHHRLMWYDLCPILSYIFLKGRCRYCKEKISPQYIIMEISGGLIFLITYFLYIYVYHFDASKFAFAIGPIYACFDPISVVNFLCLSFSLLIMLLASLIDHKTKEIPFTFLVIIFLLALVKWGVTFIYTKNYGLVTILGLAIPLVLFVLIYLISTLIFKVEPIGIGDIILFTSVGFMLGAYEFILVLIISSLSCSIIESIKIKKSGKKESIPFVPYIFVGYVISCLFGELLINGYLILIGVR